jgi:ADP-ribose pyrophosphatase YjhB (NUDIX family)
MLNRILVKIWRMIRGPFQWRVLWFMHSKFIAGISGVVVDENGSILLLRHRFWPEGSWGLPSGYAKCGEQFEDTLAREVNEETGYTIGVDSLLRIVTGYKLRLEITFVAHTKGGTLKLDNREVITAQFFPPEQLPDGLLSSHRELIEIFLNGSGVHRYECTARTSGTSSWQPSREEDGAR